MLLNSIRTIHIPAKRNFIEDTLHYELKTPLIYSLVIYVAEHSPFPYITLIQWNISSAQSL